MSLPWFRLYTEMIDNDKLRLLAFEDRWHYVAILCLKGSGVLDSEGENKLKQRRIAIKLGVQLPELDEIKRRLVEVGLIDNQFQPVAWDKRQFKSDSSSERVRKCRERKKKGACNVSQPLQKRNSDVIDTDTEHSKRFTKPTIEEIQQYIGEKGYSVDAQRFYDHYQANGWMRGKTKIKDWKACVRTWVNGDSSGSNSGDSYGANGI